MRKLKLFLTLLMLMCIGVTQMWGELPTNPKWVATAFADIADNATVIIISNSTTATNIALPAAGAGTSNPPKVACTVTTTDGVSTIAPPEGKTLQDLAWTIKKKTSTWQFFVEGSTTNCLYLNSTSSNTALRVGNGSSNNEFVMGDLGKLLKVSTAARFVGPYDNSGSDWRTYGTENAANYKGATLTFYVLQATPSCSSEITITKGDNPANGTFVIDNSGKVCIDEGNATVNVTATPNAGYHLATVTSTVGTVGDIDGNSCAITNISASTTINVTFAANPKYTVSFNVGGSSATVNPKTEASAGAGISLPEGPTPTCSDDWEFAGWAEDAVGIETTAAPTFLSGTYHPTENTTLYAVYKRTEEGGNSETKYVQVTSLTQINAGGTFIITNGSYMPSTTSTSAGPSKETMPAVTDGVITGTVTNDMLWNFSSADGDGYVTVTNADGKYLSAGNSNTGLRVNTTEDSWKFEEYTVSNVLGFSMQEKTNSRYCAEYTDGSDWRPYTSKNATNYKTNSGRLDLYKATEVSSSTTYYLSAPSCTPPSCELKVNISAGETPENGDFTLNKTGDQLTCDADVEVVVTPLPAEHYHVGGVTASNSKSISDPDSDGKYTVTYAQATNAASTINVTFAEDTKYQVTWNVNGNENTKTQVYAGEKPVFPATPQSCDDEGGSTTFIGWATAPWTGKLANLSEKTVYTSASAMPEVSADVIYYAVFAKSSGSAANLFSWAGGSSTNLSATEGVYSLSADSKDYADETYSVKWNGTGKNIVIEVASQPGKVAAGFKMIGGNSTSTITVQEADAADGTFTDVENLSISGATDDVVNLETTASFKSTTRAIKLYYTKGSNVGLGPISIEGVVTYSDYMTTCCTKHAISIATGILNGSVEADLVEACEGATVTLTFAPALNYHLSGWTLNGVAQDVNANTFSMPAGAATVSATFAEDECTPLNTPSVNVSGKAYPYNAVKLAWTAIEHADKYKVYIYDNEDNELEHNDAFTGVEYTIGQALSASTTYKYSVQAVSNTPATYCPSEAATGSFVTEALPTAHLTLIDPSGIHASSGDYAILTPFNLPSSAAVPEGCPKVFVGWDSNDECATEPAYAAGAEFTFANTTGVTLYAVYATATPGVASLTKMGSSYVPTAGDNLVIVGVDSDDNSEHALYQETSGSSYVKHWTFDNKVATVAADAKKYVTLEAATEGKFYMGDATNGYVYSSSSNNLSVDASNKTAWTIAWDNSDNAFTFNQGRYLSCRKDLTGENKYLYRLAGSTPAGIYKLDVYKYAIGPTTYSEYTTECEACNTVTLKKSGEDSDAGNTFALKVGDDVVQSVMTCAAASVTIEPTVATGYEVSFEISTLTGASLSGNTISLAKDADGELTVTATFSQIGYSVTMAQAGGAEATISEDQTNKHYNDEITVTAQAKDGYIFTGWTASPAVTFANAKALETTFPMPNSNVTVTATYEEIHDVSWALANTPSTDSSDSVYVKGLISKKEKLENDNTISYWISDNGQHTTGSVLEVYKGKGVNKVTFSSLDDLNVGDEVVVRGKLKTYNSTKEFDNGNYMYSRTEAAVASVAIDGSAEKTAYSPSDNTFSFAGLTATATYNTGYVKDVTAEATWTANSAASYTVAAGGDVTVKATFGGQYDEEVVTVTYTSKTVKEIYLEYKSTYTFKGMDLPKPKVYAEYVEEIADDEITSLVEAANGYDTESAYDKNTPNNYTIKVEYESFNAEYTVQVRKIFDNEDAPHNVADATALIVASAYQSTTSSTDYMWVRGIVSGFNGTYNNRYYISDDGTASGQLYVFNGTYFNGAAFTADNKLKVGDEVILKATILNYNGATPELTNSQVTYQLRDPAFAFADVVAGDEFEPGFSADMTVEPTSNEGEAEFTLSSGNTDAVTIVAGKLHAVAEGDAVITASRAATDNTGSINYKAKNATFNVHVIAERTRYVITMDADGGSGDDPEYANQLQGATVDLPASCPYTKASSAFAGWVVKETVSGDAVAVTDGHFTMPAAAVTIKATWNTVGTCAISFQVSGAEVATADAPQTAEFSLAGVSHPTVEGFEFVGWSETEYADEVTTLPTTISSYTPEVGESTKTLYGIYSQVVGGASNLHYVLDYTDENLATNTNWGSSYGSAYNYTAADGGAWVIKAYKNSGMQINTGKDASIKIPNCSGEIISISITCGAAKAVGLSASDYSGSGTITYIAEGTDATSQTLDLSGKSVKGGYIVPKSGSTAITHIDVEYSGNVTYYTSSPVARYNVTYAKGDAIGVTGLCEAQRYAAGEITLCDAPTCADKNFAKWSDGTSLYAAGASYTLSADVAFTATWTPKPKYTVTYTANGGTGTAPAVEEYMEGETVEVKENEYFSKPGFDYDGWLIVYNDGVSDQEITPENGEFEMVAYNVTIKAKWAEESKQKWALVTEASQLEVNAKYVIAAAGYDYAMAAQKSNNRDATAIVKRNEGAQMKGTSSMQVITLEGSTGAWEFNTDAGYLYAASSSGNQLKTQATNDVNGKWAITFENGVTSVVASGSSNRNVMQFNNGSTLFACYATASQSAVALYKEIPMTVINTEGMDQNDVPDGGDMTINEDQTWTVTSDKEVGDLYMEDGGIIANSAKVEANDLYFKAKAGKSNQIFDLSKITVISNLYYDFQLCDGDVDADYWYSISVPFDVNLNDGVFQVGGTTPLVNHSDFEVWEYDTQKRADTQSNGWKRSSDNMMHAGKAYLIGFNPGQPNIIRLKAAANWKEHLFTGGTSMSVTKTAEIASAGDHDNWNGLANPTGRYIDVNADAQVFNNNTHQFDPFTYDALAYNFVVGTAFFVQSASAVTISNEDHGQYRAPKRAEAESSKCAYAVRITRDEATSFDNQIIVRASEGATSEYEQGHDMLTMNNATSKTAAMLWTKNYGGKRLAIEEAPFRGDKASYELGIYAPAAGEYAISVPAPKDNADLYLTKNGMIIWNLSMNECTLTLEKGNNDGFGLLLVKKAPQVSTGVESTEFSGQNAAVQKVIIDEHVYILREGQMYDVTGKMVK